MDFGTGDGVIARTIGKYFRLKLPTYGTDVEMWHSQTHSNTSDDDFVFQYLTRDGKIPFDDKKFDIVTCLMVLHHIREFDKSIEDIKSHMVSNSSIFIVREHDASNQIVKDLCDVEHACHNIVNEGQNYMDFKAQYYGHYLSKMEWQECFQCLGFKCIYVDPLATGPNQLLLYGLHGG